MEIRFPKLYRYDRNREHCQVTIPFAKGALKEEELIRILQAKETVPCQTKVTSRYEDGSIRFALVRFMADLPANKKTTLEAVWDRTKEDSRTPEVSPIKILSTGTGYAVQGGVDFSVSNGSASIFDWLEAEKHRYTGKQFIGPVLEDGKGNRYGIRLGKWQVAERGPLTAVLTCMGTCEPSSVTFELKLTAWAEKPWVEISYRLINSTDEPLHAASLVFGLLAEETSVYDPSMPAQAIADSGDSAGEGAADRPNLIPTDTTADTVSHTETIFQVTGIRSLSQVEKQIPRSSVRTCAASSNYKTNFLIGRNGTAVSRTVDASWLIQEANEHMAEVFYGTFFADRTDQNGGVCATIFQAQQNYPKAVKADQSGIYVMLVPKDVNKVVLESGMSREQRFLLHFHSSSETLTELDNRSLIYQMPDRPTIPAEVFQKAGVFPDIFVDKGQCDPEVEAAFIARADSHARCYGMLNWGDAPDPGYTTQGRGKGKPVWTNNEYDFPHACALLYARTGQRRFLDYMLTACSHWMDVDICHYSKDPLLLGGQWEHCRRHCLDSIIVCSHQWVEGLLDYYHFTGDERALRTALGIGDNILRLLETPMYQKSGEMNARETGWALRSLSALYTETNDEKWLSRCDWITDQFKEWSDTYGGWLSPYTDNTMIRVGFMISVAVGSLMRYYRVTPHERVRAEMKELILNAVDDLVEECYMEDTGVFYYKELPSLTRLGNNTLLLEALTIACELSGDPKYLKYGLRTFWNTIQKSSTKIGGTKTIIDDAVIVSGDGTKTFAQSYIPLAVFYKALADHGML